MHFIYNYLQALRIYCLNLQTDQYHFIMKRFLLFFTLSSILSAMAQGRDNTFNPDLPPCIIGDTLILQRDPIIIDSSTKNAPMREYIIPTIISTSHGLWVLLDKPSCVSYYILNSSKNKILLANDIYLYAEHPEFISSDSLDEGIYYLYIKLGKNLYHTFFLKQ